MSTPRVRRTRMLVVVVAAVLALAGLAGCRSNIGTAAVVNGEKISDTQVTNAISQTAQPVEVSQTQSLAPRSFVVQILVRLKLFREIVAKGPNGGPSAAELASISKRALAGKSASAFADAQQVKGYSASFDRDLVTYLAYIQVLRTYSTNGVDIGKLAAGVKMSVRLSPRYGSWDRAQLGLSATASAGLPGFLSLQPTAAPGGGAGSAAAPTN